jgi:hypothetical protein
MHSLGSNSAIASEKKIFLNFPIWSCVNTMIYGGSHLGFRIGIKNPNFVAFFSETTNMIKTKLNMNVHWIVLYKLYVFCSDMKFKMAATAQFRFNQCNSFREEYISVFSP